MGLWKSLAGIVRVEITSADPAGMLTEINAKGITLFDVAYIGDLTIQGSLYRKDHNELRKLLEHRGERLKTVRRQGLFWFAKKMVHRPLLLFCAAVFLLLVMFLPSRIFFVRVEGNSSIPTYLILEKAEFCGISFGASRREVRSERMKNALLAQIPELQWAGVNTSGCVATISVREKSVAEEVTEETAGVSSIVAARDGIISECTVLRGNALCQVGQAVKAGQTLVSGYTDLGLTIKATRAKAEIFAQTLRDLEIITPASAVTRGEITGQETRYSLLIGKKLINFYKDSGISDTTCVKMYSEDYLTLPGGFQLPVAIVRETWVYYDTQTAVAADAESFSWMQSAAETYLQGQMIAGQILNRDTTLQMQNGSCCLSGQYACLEMIGQVKNEEIIQRDGESG